MNFVSSTACLLGYKLWGMTLKAGTHEFFKAVENPQKRCNAYLLELLSKNKNTLYGKEHAFGAIKTPADYKKNAPLTVYEDYAPFIDKIAAGEKGVLTEDEVLLFEPTSGSSGPVKLIPYTTSLKRDFSAGIAPWLSSTFAANPGAMRGEAYWSITPAQDIDKMYGQIQVGFEDDSEYLGFFGKLIQKKLFAVPGDVKHIHDPDAFKRKTLAWMIARKNLRLISIWSPTFLSLLVEYLGGHLEEVLRELYSLGFARRAREVEKLFLRYDLPEALRGIWPGLSLISCWAHGPSRHYARKLSEYFPGTPLEEKGVISTEAMVSIPVAGAIDPVLSVCSHYFEFQNTDDLQVYDIGQLKEGAHYKVIVTTGGGLYRYQSGDIVEITGRYKNTPTMKFISNDNVSDLFGEKVSYQWAAKTLEEIFVKTGLRPDIFFLSPIQTGNKGEYCLFIDAKSMDESKAEILAAELESSLMQNYHYLYCRKLGQLSGASVFRICSEPVSGLRQYKTALHKKGIKIGDIKPAAIDARIDWRNIFQGSHYGSNIPVSF